jgi:hypothetical protein
MIKQTEKDTYRREDLINTLPWHQLNLMAKDMTIPAHEKEYAQAELIRSLRLVAGTIKWFEKELKIKIDPIE